MSFLAPSTLMGTHTAVSKSPIHPSVTSGVVASTSQLFLESNKNREEPSGGGSTEKETGLSRHLGDLGLNCTGARMDGTGGK